MNHTGTWTKVSRFADADRFAGRFHYRVRIRGKPNDTWPKEMPEPHGSVIVSSFQELSKAWDSAVKYLTLDSIEISAKDPDDPTNMPEHIF